MPQPRLQLTHITKRYPAVVANDAIHLTVQPGEIHAVLGENGAGKSTLFKAIMGLVKPSSGSVTVMNQDMTGAPPYKIAQLGVAYVPEGRGIFGNLSVTENLKMTARAGKSAAAKQRADKQQDWNYDRVLETFPRLKERLNHGGQLLAGQDLPADLTSGQVGDDHRAGRVRLHLERDALAADREAPELQRAARRAPRVGRQALGRPHHCFAFRCLASLIASPLALRGIPNRLSAASTADPGRSNPSSSAISFCPILSVR